MNTEYIAVLQKEIKSYLEMMRDPSFFWQYGDICAKYTRACEILDESEKEGLEVLSLHQRCTEHHKARVKFVRAVLAADEHDSLYSYKKHDDTGENAELLYGLRRDMESHGRDEEDKLSENELKELNVLIRDQYLFSARRKFAKMIGVLQSFNNQTNQIEKGRHDLQEMIKNGDLKQEDIEKGIGSTAWVSHGLPGLFNVCPWFFLRKYR